jgi:hypothetical protein
MQLVCSCRLNTDGIQCRYLGQVCLCNTNPLCNIMSIPETNILKSLTICKLDSKHS